MKIHSKLALMLTTGGLSQTVRIRPDGIPKPKKQHIRHTGAKERERLLKQTEVRHEHSDQI